MDHTIRHGRSGGGGCVQSRLDPGPPPAFTVHMTSDRLLSVLALLTSISLAACGSGAGDTGSGGDDQGAGGGGGEGGAAGTTNPAGGGGGAAELGEPIDAPLEQWTWVGFDDAFCADGSTTGIGVNLTDRSSKVVIYLMGGGACWDNTTCYVYKTAVNIESGYGEAQFNSDSKGLDVSIFNRADMKNPLRDASYFFVPYCTGDIHGGNNPDADYGGKKTKHVGFKNMEAYLRRIVATVPNAERVVLSGSSAGGFGAGLNWWQTQAAFGDMRVDLVDDSGPPLAPPYLSASLEGQWRSAWNLKATLPEGCTGCESSLSALFGFYAAQLPKNRAALLSYTHDNVIAAYFGITTDQVAAGLGVLGAELDTYSNTRYYYLGGEGHVLLGDPGGTSQNGVVLIDWLTDMLADDPDWASVKP